MYKTQYVHLPDDTAEHIIGDGQRTECGVPIPYNSPWTNDPEGKVCSDCKKVAGLADEAQAAVDAQHEAEMKASAPPVVEPVPAEPVTAPKGKAKSGDKA
jgi:hypothetical protein